MAQNPSLAKQPTSGGTQESKINGTLTPSPYPVFDSLPSNERWIVANIDAINYHRNARHFRDTKELDFMRSQLEVIESQQLFWKRAFYNAIVDSSDFRDKPSTPGFRKLFDNRKPAYSVQDILAGASRVWEVFFDGAKNGWLRSKFTTKGVRQRIDKKPVGDWMTRLNNICLALRTEKKTCVEVVEDNMTQIQCLVFSPEAYIAVKQSYRRCNDSRQEHIAATKRERELQEKRKEEEEMERRASNQQMPQPFGNDTQPYRYDVAAFNPALWHGQRDERRIPGGENATNNELTVPMLPATASIAPSQAVSSPRQSLPTTQPASHFPSHDSGQKYNPSLATAKKRRREDGADTYPGLRPKKPAKSPRLNDNDNTSNASTGNLFDPAIMAATFAQAQTGTSGCRNASDVARADSGRRASPAAQAAADEAAMASTLGPSRFFPGMTCQIYNPKAASESDEDAAVRQLVANPPVATPPAEQDHRLSNVFYDQWGTVWAPASSANPPDGISLQHFGDAGPQFLQFQGFINDDAPSSVGNPFGYGSGHEPASRQS